MRSVALLLALLLVLVVAYCAYMVATGLRQRRTLRLRGEASWRVRHYNDDGRTVVAVSLITPTGAVLDEQVVARLPDDDADWQSRFLHARQEAEERAFHLNGTA